MNNKIREEKDIIKQFKKEMISNRKNKEKTPFNSKK